MVHLLGLLFLKVIQVLLVPGVQLVLKDLLDLKVYPELRELLELKACLVQLA
ncbi:Hypothetical protein POVN_LOCUS666 [uncultured virus]|nr:Hypothetical protein POVN_LOCUS666 [uncultured virus]